MLDEQVLPSVVGQGFDEVVVVGDYVSGNGYRHIPFRPIYRNTSDAQFKRDVGTLVTSSEWLVYLCDDHALDDHFVVNFPLRFQRGIIGVPHRVTKRNGRVIPLNMGLPEYCGGHAGVYHRSAIQQVPWQLAPLHPNWDVLHSRMLLARGYELVPLPDCVIVDVEPGSEPWQ